MQNINYSLDQLKACIFGLSVGDALGVPVEFKPRSYLKSNPVQDMMGYGTYNQPPGTWSDDSSLTFCLLDSLCEGYNPNDIAQKFSHWLYNKLWTPHNYVFDVGVTTRDAINRFEREGNPFAGRTDVNSNGNGSLMRIAPLTFYLLNKPIEQRWQITKEVASLTHGHIRGALACFIYIEFMQNLLSGQGKIAAYENTKQMTLNFFENILEWASEKQHFFKILYGDITNQPLKDIFGSGYVVHCLEASLWCFLKNDNYQSAVLQAVNLGEDTDTTATVTGALAGLYYGLEQIPTNWLNQLARKNDIEALVEKFYNQNQ